MRSGLYYEVAEQKRRLVATLRLQIRSLMGNLLTVCCLQKYLVEVGNKVMGKEVDISEKVLGKMTQGWSSLVSSGLGG